MVVQPPILVVVVVVADEDEVVARDHHVIEPTVIEIAIVNVIVIHSDLNVQRNVILALVLEHDHHRQKHSEIRSLTNAMNLHNVFSIVSKHSSFATFTVLSLLLV